MHKQFRKRVDGDEVGVEVMLFWELSAGEAGNLRSRDLEFAGMARAATRH